MRTILVLLLLSICIILMVGIYIQQPRLFGDTATVVNTPVRAMTYTPVNNSVIDLHNVHSTQTAIAVQAPTTAQSATMVVQTATVNPNQPVVKPTIVKPARLPDTGNVDSSDIWINTPILLLIGVFTILSLGFYWHSKRALK